MSEILSFMAGSVFTLLLAMACMGLLSRISDREGTERRKRRLPSPPLPSSGGVVRPKTPEQRRLEKDEEFQEIKRIIEEQ